MNTNILYFPSNYPLPPVPTGAALASWKITMAKAHPTTMPIVVPHWWSVWYTMDTAQGLIPKPIDTVKAIRDRMEVSRQRQRLGVVGQTQLQGVAA